MHAFDVLGDHVRRRILELLEHGERPAGDIGATVQREFGISQPAVSQHLRVLREAGFTSARAEGTRRLYAVNPAPLREAADWIERYRRHWDSAFDVLDGHLSNVQGRPVRSSRVSTPRPSPVATRKRKPGKRR